MEEKKEKNINAQELGKLGGRASADKRFKGMSQKEISDKMRAVRYSKEEMAEFEEMKKETLEAFRKIK